MALSTSTSILRNLLGISRGRDAAANLLRITLADALRPLDDPKEIQRDAARVIGEHFNVARVNFATVDRDSGLAVVKDEYAKGVPSAIGNHRITNYGHPFPNDETNIFACPDVSREPELQPALDYYRGLQIASIVVVRLVRKKQLAGVLTVSDSRIRRWRKSEIGLIAEAAERVWTALERVETEAALRKSEELHRLVAQATHDILWDWNPETNRVEWSDALHEKLGYRREEVSGIRTWGKLIHPEDWERVASRYYGGLEDGRNSWTDEYRLRRKDGTYATLLDRGLIARDSAGKPVRMVGSMMDITELRNAEEALRKANVRLVESGRRKDEFLAMLAHELRNPLAAAKNAAELLTLKTKEDGNRQLIELLLRQMHVLGNLVDDLLDVSRVTRGLITLKQDSVDVASVAKSALESVRGLFEEKDHRVQLLSPAGAVVVQGDPVRLEQILVNLLTNAAKYTDPGGQISLQVAAENGVAHIRIRDNGIGIDPAMRESIFSLFGQAERGLDRSQGGLGIGLTIVKRLVQLHGGKIEMHSEGLGCGTEFVITLPLGPTTGLSENSTTPAPHKADGGKRILVVEDSEEIALTLTLLLEEAGHQVTTVSNGPLALEQAERSAPDLVLLDIGLPGMDGYEVARRMRANPTTRESTLAALTGYGQASDQRLSEAAGFDAHFVKPVDFSVLCDYISHVKPLRTGAEYQA